MDPIKICFITREYAHEKMGKTGGIGVFLKQFAPQLLINGFEVHVFSFGKRNISFKDEGITVCKVKDISNLNERVRAFVRFLKLPGYESIKQFLEYCNRLVISAKASAYCRKNDIDIVEFHDYGGDALNFKGKMAQVVRCHGTATTLTQFMDYPRRKIDDVFETKFFKNFKGQVVAVSNFSARTTQKAFNLSDMPKVIYNGVGTGNLDKGTDSPYVNDNTLPFSIFYFGSIRERKGIDVACRVFNLVVKEFPEASFHVMGNNNNDHWNRTCIKILNEEAKSRTTYYGVIDNKKIYDYLQKAHVVLFPSYGENFSIALLEVMAIGKLSIVSKIPAFEEIIEDRVNGFFAETESEYIDTISMIFNSEIILEKISNNATSTIKNGFLLEDKIMENVEFYKSLINKV